MAHLAAVLGAIGAPLVLVSSRRTVILAGLALIALAEGVLAVSGPGAVSPARAALGIVGLAGLVAFTVVFVRRPELVPLVILIAAPFRMPLDFGASHRFYVGLPENGQIGRLLPLYGVVAAAALALAWRLVRERSPGPAAAATRDRRPARRARLVRCTLRALVLRRRCSAEPAAVLPAPVRPPRCGRRPVAVPGLDASRHGDRRGRDSGALRHRGPRRAGHAPGDLLLARRGGGQRVLELLPGDLAVPRPEPLRPSPRARDRDRADGRVVPEDRVPPRCRRDRVPVRRSLLLVLPVEPRRALRRGRVHRRGGRGPDGAARRGDHRRARARGRRGVRGRQGRRSLDPTRHERPLTAHRPDHEGLRAAPTRGRRPGLPATGEPGAFRRTAARPACSSPTRRLSRSRPSSASSGSSSTSRCSLERRRRSCACSGSRRRSASPWPPSSRRSSSTRSRTPASSRIRSRGSCSGWPRASSRRGRSPRSRLATPA